ncbi:MAG: SEC-C metal-binding domain-containing protein, partial [Acidobacteriota bacterium]
MEKTNASEPSKNPLLPVFELMQGGDAEAIAAKYGLSRSELEQRVKDYQESRRQAALADNLTMQKVGRNDPCPCGSGKKYKKCCMAQHEEARKNMPADKLQEMEELQKRREKLEKDVQKGFETLFTQDFKKAMGLASRLLENYPEDDRLHDIMLTTQLATADYDGAFRTARARWQVAQEEKDFYQENGFHKREGVDRKELVHFYSPSTWLEKLWIAQRARAWQEEFPKSDDSLAKLASGLKIANDTRRFPGRQEEGFEMRRAALEPTLKELEEQGDKAIPYLLPLTYTFSWASLFIPDLLAAIGTDASLSLLAELSMFRFPYFSQKCLVKLEGFGNRAVAAIDRVMGENAAFDELKVGLISVLGNIHTPESFSILIKLTDHENPYLVNWVAQSLG